VRKDGQLEVLAARNEELGGSMVYPFWHPTGKYIAYSTNQTRQNFHQLSDLRVEVYDETSDVIVYHVELREIILDSIVSQKDRLENYPVFSPDGKTLYYCEAQRVDSVWINYQQIKYNICRIGFDPNTGKLEGTVDTVVNVRSGGKSAVMPRVSYDGRFLLYTLCDYGCFPIWHPESDLWMMNLESGDSFPLDNANSTDAESFHNWSLNSRWIVFTSRRDDGLYTKLYLAHIREDGRADKAFCLPQYNPQEYDAETIWSFNTPDFSIAPICLEKKNLYNQILSRNREQTKLTRKMPPSLSSR
jgi:Tol biopolymer transport system component